MNSPPSASARQVLTRGVVVTMNPRRQVFSPGVVVVERDRITHVGPNESWSRSGDDRVVDCRGHVVMPGLINTHTHACFSLFRGLTEDLPRRAWAPAYAVPYQDRATPQDYYWGAMLGGLEMLTNGVT
ncbi:MAG: amidohydrolase family protein, partial [Armatimonadota bacterium]